MSYVGALFVPSWLTCNSKVNYKLNIIEYEHRDIKASCGLENGSVAECEALSLILAKGLGF